jgi:hypothetical protein
MTRASVNQGRPNFFLVKGPNPLLCAGSRVARGKISCGVRHKLIYGGLYPQVADPCHKQNCTLNRSLGTL